MHGKWEPWIGNNPWNKKNTSSWTVHEKLNRENTNQMMEALSIWEDKYSAQLKLKVRLD